MVGLHKDLHAATQVPAQLVGSAAACERRWRFDWRGPDGGPTGVPGKGLVGPPARVLPWRLLSSPARLLPGALWSSLAGVPPRVVIFHSVYLILNVFTKIYMPPRGCLPNPYPMGAVDSRVTRSVGVGRLATARVLPGLLKPLPGKDLAGGGGGSASSPLLFVVLVLASFCFFRASASPWLTSLALLGAVAFVARTARAQL